MKAMILQGLHNLETHESPLQPAELLRPAPGKGEILVKVAACGVCHTELDEIEGRTPPSRFPMILGHEIIGTVEEGGAGTARFRKGDRIGIGWIHSACGHCRFCEKGEENLCADFKATGRDAPGGYAEYTVVQEKFAVSIPDVFNDTAAAPLLCAGAVGYRSLRLAGIKNGESLGLTGFGASAHLVLMMARYLYPDSPIFVFARNEKERIIARELGALWAGDTAEAPPEALRAIIDTTPAWKPAVEALIHLQAGGRLVINAIQKENRDRDYLLHMDYPRHLWLEKEIKSVANVTRRDIEECMNLAARIRIISHVEEFSLEDANRALLELKRGKIRGAKVLKMN